MKRLVICMFFSFLLSKLYSQNNFEFEFISQEEGISSNSVMSIYKDIEGFLWVGTINGLNRFDGRSFLTFMHSAYNPKSISNNQITSIAEDQKGNLWIGTEKGLNFFDKETHTFKNFLYDSLNTQSLSNNFIKKLLLDSKGNFWIATQMGLNKLIYNGNQIHFKRYYPKRISTENTENWSIQSIVEDNEGQLWLGTWGAGLVHFNPSKGKFTHFLAHESESYSITGNIIYKMNVLHNGFILIDLSDGDRCFFDPVKRKFYTEKDLPKYHLIFNFPDVIYSVAYDNNDLLWMGTGKGLLAYSLSKGEFIHHSNPSNAKLNRNIKNREVLDQARIVYIDNTGIVWSGIGKAGLAMFDQKKNKFQKYYVTLNSENKYRDYLSSVIYKSDSEIWFGTAGNGLIKTNIEGTITERYFLKTNDNPSIKNIKTICSDINNFIWAGTEKGLFKIDPKSGKTVLHLSKSNNSDNSECLNHNSILKLYNDDNGLIWVTERNGFQILDANINKIVHHSLDSLFANDMINEVNKDCDGDYWILGENLLALYYTERDSLTYLSFQRDNGISVPLDKALSFYQDYGGVIWLGTRYGLYKIRKTNHEPIDIKPVHKCSNRIIRDVTGDINNHLWISTSNGLLRFDPIENSLIEYVKKDGIYSLAHNITAIKNGKLIILDEKGFYYFHPDSIIKNNLAPSIYFTEISINGRTIPAGDKILNETNLNSLDILKLENQEKIIKIKFSVLNFTLSENNLYAYKLEGYDTNWNYLGHNNEITIMNLDPGKYKLWINGANNDNVWSKDPKFINIHVKPPLYLSPLAYVFYFLLIIAFFLLYRYIYNNRERIKIEYEHQKLEAIKKYELEKLNFEKDHQLDQSKLKFFFDISHEFRTPLTLILGPISDLIHRKKYPELFDIHNTIYQNAINLKKLIDELLDIRKLDVGESKLLLVKDKIEPLLLTISESFQNYASSKKIKLISNIDIPDFYYLFDKGKIQKIINNILSNAVKYSHEGDEIKFISTVLDNAENNLITKELQSSMTQICVSKNSNPLTKTLYLRISDQGVGIPPSEIKKIFTRFYQVNNDKIITTQGTGIGLSLCVELISILDGNLFIESEIGKGTSIAIFLPILTGVYEKKVANYSKYKIEDNIQNNTQQIPANNKTFVSEITDSNKSNIRKPIILIVEDNPDLIKYLRDLLSEKYMVKKGLNGKEGFEMANKYFPDLIISDIMMPTMDGYQFCQKIKADVRLKHIPFLILTAKTGIEVVTEFLDLGVDDYLIKPFQSSILLSRIENLIKKHTQLKTAFKDINQIKLPEGINLVNRDEEFIQKAIDLVEKNITNPNFNKDVFAREMSVSSSQLYKKISELTHESPNEFVRNIKLKKAARILKKGTSLQISEIGYMIGFSDPNYFTRKFREYFGKTPSQYVEE